MRAPAAIDRARASSPPEAGNRRPSNTRSRRIAPQPPPPLASQILRDASASDAKRAGHAAAIAREVDALRRLRGALNVACLEDAFEDADAVHIVLELCEGGELWHAVGARHYSERTAASYMRAVLRTLAQCHRARLLHRDVKPGNFMLLDDSDRAPVKAVDFGLAVPFDPKSLPRTDLGLEGTPWYQAPEVLASRVGPEADVWAAGVMAAQLLTGRFPFDDRRSPSHPQLSRVWRSILNDKFETTGKAWDGVSDEAKDFCAWLLDREPGRRPTAEEALAHPWLRGKSSERSTGRQLPLAVVARVQRYAAASVFKRTVLEHIAAELVAAAAAAPAPSGAACGVALGGATMAPSVTDARDWSLTSLFDDLGFAGRDAVPRDELLDGLARLGYRLAGGEGDRLMAALGDSARVTRAALAASQIDWRALASTRADEWLALARSAFASLDTDGDGVLRRGDIAASLRSRLPPAEVESAVAHALSEACKRDDSIRDGLSFPQFVAMLRADDGASLDAYEGRLSSGRGRECALDALERARSTARSPLASVAEAS
jgi:calcium-dependent protein kinase